MDELKDYSGDYIPNLKLQDFSKDCLVRLFNAAGKLYLGLDKHWNAVVRERFGDDVAWELGEAMWTRATADEIKRTLKAANIQGDDLVALAKVLQVDPAINGVNKIEIEFKDDCLVFTTIRCVTLEAFERLGLDDYVKKGCELDSRMYPIVGRTVNPKIKQRMLKMPPRKSKDDIACRMEFWIED